MARCGREISHLRRCGRPRSPLGGVFAIDAAELRRYGVQVSGFWDHQPMPLDFLAIGRGYGLSMWQTQSLWDRLSNDPRYFLSRDPDSWLHTTFRREAAELGGAKRGSEEQSSHVLGGSPRGLEVGKRTLVEEVYGRKPSPRPTEVGKRTLVEEEYGGKPRLATEVGKRTLAQDLPLRNAPVATDLPFRAEVEELLGASLGDVRAYTHQDELLAPHGARAAAFRGGIAFAGNPTKDVVAHEAVHTLQLKTRGVTGDATAAEAQAETAARAAAQGASRIAMSYVPTTAVSFDKGSGSPSPGAMFANGVRRLDRSKLKFLGAVNPELWNWVQASEANATAAEVAALLIDDLPWAVKGSGVGKTWEWAVTAKANGQFEVNAVVAMQVPALKELRSSGIDLASTTNQEMKDTVDTFGIRDGDVKVAKEASGSRERGRAFLSKRLVSARVNDMLDEPRMLGALPRDYEVPNDVASGPGYTTGFDADAFYRALLPKLEAYLKKTSVGGLRKLLEPADIESEVAAMIPARERDWTGTRETTEVAAFVGGKLHDATLKALDRLVPRVIAATLANPDRALRPSEVPHHGYLDIAVLNVLLADPSPLTVARTPEQIAADKKAEAELAKAQKRRLRKLDYAGLRRMLDLTLVRVNSARDLSAPWVVPISQDLLEWVAKHQDHIAGMPEAEVRELVPVIEEQFAIVRDAYSGLEAIAENYAKPISSEDAEQTPEYGAMYQYAMAISESRSAATARRHLASARALDQKLYVTATAHRVRAARTAMAQGPLGKNEGVANPAEVYGNQLQREEAALWYAGQGAVAGDGIDAAQLTEVGVAADERAALYRLRGIVRKVQQLGEVADTVDATDALRILLAVSGPVNQARVTLEQELANAARVYKTAGGTNTAKATWFTKRREAVVKANETLATVVKEHDLERVFARAQSEIKDAQIRKIITELVVMFALGLVTGGVATAVGGLARGMMLARTARGMYMVGEAVEVVGGGGYVMAQLAGGFAALGADVTLMSLGQSALTGQPLHESLTQNLIGSSVMALAMKPFGFIAHDLKEIKAGLVAKGTVLTMEVIASSAANFAATQLQAAGSASEPELFDWLTQGGMMVVGKAVGVRLAETHTRLAKLGEAVGMRKLAPLRELARQIRQGKNIESLPKLVEGEREVLAIESEAIARARESGSLRSDDIAAIEAGNQAAAADVAPERVATTLWAARGLEPISGDGTHWYGTRKQISDALADARVKPSDLVRETATTVTYRVNGQDVQFTIGLPHSRPSRTQSRAAPRRNLADRPAAPVVVQTADRPVGTVGEPLRARAVDGAAIDAQMAQVGHAQSDLHSHFMGNVPPERIRDELATSGVEPMRDTDVSTWEPLLRQIVATATPEMSHQTKDGAITRRGASGDAVEIVKRAQEEIEGLKYELNGDSVKDDAIRSKIESAAKSAAEEALRASEKTDFNSSYEVRDELVKRFYGASKRASVMGANEAVTPILGQLEAHFQGRPAVLERIQRAAELEARTGKLTGDETRTLEQLQKLVREQFGYDQYALDTMVRLAHDNVTYTEQSNSIKKLQTRFDEGQTEWLKAEAKRQHPELSRQIEALVIKHLAMIETRNFGDRDAALGDVNPTRHRRADDESFEGDVVKLQGLMKRGDVAGMDVAGMEHYRFDADGAARFRKTYEAMFALAKETGRRLVLRPHVGEGGIDTVTGMPFHREANRQVRDGKLTHYDRAENNIEVLVGALEDVARHFGKDGRLPDEVTVRFGHATHTTPDQAARMTQLGVIVEVNLGSNQATAAVTSHHPSTLDPATGHVVDRTLTRDQMTGTFADGAKNLPDLEDHSLGTLIFNETDVVLATDGHEVMNTSLKKEFETATKYVAEVKLGKIEIPITAHQARAMNAEGGSAKVGAQGDHETIRVSYSELSPAKKRLFDNAMRRFYETAHRYLQIRPHGSTEI